MNSPYFWQCMYIPCISDLVNSTKKSFELEASSPSHRPEKERKKARNNYLSPDQIPHGSYFVCLQLDFISQSVYNVRRVALRPGWIWWWWWEWKCESESKLEEINTLPAFSLHRHLYKSHQLNYYSTTPSNRLYVRT